MGKEDAELIRQLKSLNENIVQLSTITALNMGKDAILKDKKDTWDKIEALEAYGLSDKMIALIVGSTPASIQTLRSKNKKSKKEKDGTPAPTDPKKDEVPVPN
jgi:TolA-binding protein